MEAGSERPQDFPYDRVPRGKWRRSQDENGLNKLLINVVVEYYDGVRRDFTGSTL